MVVIALTLAVVQQRRHAVELADLRAGLPPAMVGNPFRALPAATGIVSSQAAVTIAHTASAVDARPKVMEPPEQRDHLEIAFLDDSADPAWTVKARRVASDKLTAVLPEGSVLRSIECHASICRIESSHADAERYQKFFRTAFMDPSTQVWNAGGFTAPMDDKIAPDGPIVMVSYLAREGRQLPTAEE